MKIPFSKQLLVKNKAVRPIVGLWKRLKLKKFISNLFFKAKIANYNVTDRYFILIFIVHVPLIFLKGNNSVFNIRKNLEVSLLYGNKMNKWICQQVVMPDNQNINFVARAWPYMQHFWSWKDQRRTREEARCRTSSRVWFPCPRSREPENTEDEEPPKGHGRHPDRSTTPSLKKSKTSRSGQGHSWNCKF